ncbi:hypothetical protein DPMN_102659 [Dreissena polymorpha]|uniref:Uncharacterized protein n=1 Tax=Dreissena polymorpha TaxID=45954 RepID=A0A9D4LJR2_DREPO|nr:hypothetical protein DPMN_102659 [Dreissena polymorpha]
MGTRLSYIIFRHCNQSSQARSQGIEKGARIFPPTIVIEQRSDEGGRCGRGCPRPAIGEFGGPPLENFENETYNSTF